MVGWYRHMFIARHSLNDGLSPMAAAAAARRRKEGKRENSTLIRQKCAALPAVNGCIGIDTSIMPSLQLGVVILEATETARKKQGDLGSQNASLYFIDWHKTVIFMRHPHDGFSSRARAPFLFIVLLLRLQVLLGRWGLRCQSHRSIGRLVYKAVTSRKTSSVLYRILTG